MNVKVKFGYNGGNVAIPIHTQKTDDSSESDLKKKSYPARHLSAMINILLHVFTIKSCKQKEQLLFKIIYTPPTSKHSQKIFEYLNQIPTDKFVRFLTQHFDHFEQTWILLTNAEASAMVCSEYMTHCQDFPLI